MYDEREISPLCSSVSHSCIVHLLQIPGGKKFDSVVVNGFVCTKNIAHKKVCIWIHT